YYLVGNSHSHSSAGSERRKMLKNNRWKAGQSYESRRSEPVGRRHARSKTKPSRSHKWFVFCYVDAVQDGARRGFTVQLETSALKARFIQRIFNKTVASSAPGVAVSLTSD